MLYPSG
jgi:dihydrolipoamide dehydrogenase